jgi:hypothetical protein
VSNFIHYYAECRYAECRYAECRYAECRYAECRYAQCCFPECPGAIISADTVACTICYNLNFAIVATKACTSMSVNDDYSNEIDNS